MRTQGNRLTVLIRVILSILVILAISGCASKPAYWKLYSSMEEELIPYRGVLRGRSIVIDPGHGGKFRGVVGTGSVSEADVNLGVALYLWGMLENAGAEVYLTRTIDRDFLTPGSDELSLDLENRMIKANSFEADVFISIHHNSSLPLKRDRNRIEVYYRNNDFGGSAELARITRLHLDRNLGMDKSVVKPGNYFVLRNSNAGAAILGEASYLSHPVVEDSLKLASKQKLEAQAYFIALQNYFSRGVPSVRLVSPEADTLGYSPSIVYRVDNTTGIEPSSARIYINGREYIPSLEEVSGTIYFGAGADTPNGEYTVSSRIRSVGGATGSSRPFRFVINRPPEYFLPLPPEAEPGSGFTLSARILDSFGNPVIDRSPVIITSPGTEKEIYRESSGGVCSFRVGKDALPGTFTLSSWGVTDTLYFEKPDEPGNRIIQLTDSRTGDPVRFPLIAAAGDGTLLEGDSNGRVRLPSPLPEQGMIIFSGGYKPERIDSSFFQGEKLPSRIALEPLSRGDLAGKRIALNPACGGDHHGTTGRNKIRESTVNGAIAESVRDLLRACGADVIMTRKGEETVSAEERLATVNRFRPDLAVSINHDMDTAEAAEKYVINHYPGSRQGERISNIILELLAPLFPEGKMEIRESAGLFLTHTACPATEIHLGSLSEKGAEEVMDSPGYRYYISERIFSAVSEFFGGGQSVCINPLTVKVLSGGAPLEGCYVTIDNLLTLPAGKSGSAGFSDVDPGEHLIVVQKDGETIYRSIHSRPEGQAAAVIEIEIGE
ncbi:MAG: N-acetylmuramoyl-L-alanine amidase [Candidatus Krumholzibacteriales bacterium]